MDQIEPLDAVVRRTVTLDASVDLVWETLTSTDDLQDWLGLEMDGSVAPGAVGRMHEDGTVREVLVVEVTPGSSIHWHASETASDGHDISTVSITVDRVGDQSVVTVVETKAVPRGASGACARSEDPFDSWDHRLAGLRSAVRMPRTITA